MKKMMEEAQIIIMNIASLMYRGLAISPDKANIP
jgi:hypothetical protein